MPAAYAGAVAGAVAGGMTGRMTGRMARGMTGIVTDILYKGAVIAHRRNPVIRKTFCEVRSLLLVISIYPVRPGVVIIIIIPSITRVIMVAMITAPIIIIIFPLKPAGQSRPFRPFDKVGVNL